MPQAKDFHALPNVQDQGITDARVKAPEFGKAAVGAGIARLGEDVSQAGEKVDQIQDVQARVEANRLSIEHATLASQIGQRVRQTLGEGAPAAVDQGVTDLKKGTDDILAKASPRARLLLQGEVAQRNLTSEDSWAEHGFSEENLALKTSSEARTKTIMETAADEPDEHKALALLAPITDPENGINATLARHFGYGDDWKHAEDFKVASQFFKSRALKLGVGPNASASAVIEYATKYRRYLSDDDYQSITQAYNHDALGEMADHIIDGAPLPSSTTAETPNSDGQPQRTLDPRSYFESFTVPHEGSARVMDSNGHYAQYGVNGKFHPEVDQGPITKDHAYQVFKADWDKSGAGNLPPALAAIHADTAFMAGAPEANKILAESGRDPDKYLALRTQFLNGLIASNPAKYGKYQKAWDNRTKELESFSARQGTDGTPLNVAPDANLGPTKDAIMARTDIGAAMKHMLIERIEQRRQDAHQAQEQVQHDAAGKLALSAAQLGDNFTDVKQLPQDAWLAASDETRAQLTNSAKNNKETKPLDPKVAMQIGFLQTFRPESLADPHVLNDLAAKGVPQKTIASLAEFGGKAKGAAMKPDQIDRGTLETLAKDPYIAAGYDLWSTQTDKKKNPAGYAAEVQNEAMRRVHLMNFLMNEATSWALANPNKKADTATMQKWIATSLIRVGLPGGRGLPVGTLNDKAIIAAYGENNYQSTMRILKQNNVDATPENVARYLRKKFMLDHR